MAEVKETKPKATVKAAVLKEEPKKETAPKAAAEKKPAAKKAAAPKKAPVAKAAPAPKAAPAAKKPAAKKAAPAKKTVTVALNVQYAGKSFAEKDLVARAKEAWVKDLGKKEEELTEVELYVKPEDNKVYYVLNGIAGSYDI